VFDGAEVLILLLREGVGECSLLCCETGGDSIQPSLNKGKGMYMTLDIANPIRGTQVWHAFSMDHSVLPATHNHTLIHQWNESYLPLTSQSKLVLIY